jgi:hypothetical protein
MDDYGANRGLGKLRRENLGWYPYSPMPFHLYVSSFAYLAVPVLLTVAFRAWKTHAYESWRGRLGLASMLVISADWCSVFFLIVATKTNLPWVIAIDENWLSLLYLVTPIVAALLAFTLKGRARNCTFAAGLSMALFAATFWVE